MSVHAYYNENDPKAAAWLRELIKAGLIAKGEVDERSIEDVRPSDLRGFTQCHFFAGIGGWSYALRLAGWPDDKPVWTGSCPCQPWSAAGKRAGEKDKRNLWPAWFRLIREYRPEVIFGEQVASSDVLGRVSRAIHSVQAMQNRETLRSVQDLFRSAQVQTNMSGLSERTGAQTTVSETSAHCGAAQEMEAGESSQCDGIGSKSSVSREGHDLRSRRREHPIPNKFGSMRTDWDAVRLNGPSEQPVIGQDRPLEGLHNVQHPHCINDGEHHDEQMGTGENSRNCRCYSESGVCEEAIREFDECIDGEAERKHEKPWLSTVQLDLEGEGYSCGPVVFPACGVGAPHIRQRLWFVADTNGGARRQERALHRGRDTRSDALEGAGPGGSGVSRILADTDGGDAGAEGLQRGGQYGLLTPNGVACELVHACGSGAGRDAGAILKAQRETPVRAERDGAIAPGPTNGAWARAEWIYCRDGKVRPVEPGTFPLAHGAPARVGRLRGYGNAIVVQAAAEVIAAYLEASA